MQSKKMNLKNSKENPFFFSRQILQMMKQLRNQVIRQQSIKIQIPNLLWKRKENRSVSLAITQST